MANSLERYGIKEVADVTFYDIDTAGKPSTPVLFLDTLKVSTIEQTAELAEARGGKGNPSLIAWDYGKEITVTLEDALFSAKSMSVMYGSELKDKLDAESGIKLIKTVKWIAESEQSTAPKSVKVELQGETKEVAFETGAKTYDAEGEEVSTFEAGATYFTTGTISVEGSVIEISAKQFPGTYYITGDTYARSETTGKDEFFQFIIPKAKVQSENTLTLEAEGDPSVFSMNLKVLRPSDGVMMRLVKYDITAQS